LLEGQKKVYLNALLLISSGLWQMLADGQPRFKKFDSLDPVVTTAMCFDDLLTPADHPSRSRSDTYYVDDGHVGALPALWRCVSCG
jgi:hypothetical protein